MGVRHSFMHFLSFILISLFLFFSTCGNKKGVKKGCQALFYKRGVTKGVSGTLLCIFLFLPLKKGVRHSFMHFLQKGCQALFYAFSYFYLNLFSSRFLLFIFFRYNFYSLVGDFNLLIKKGVRHSFTKKGVKKGCQKKGVRHSFMHFLTSTLISFSHRI